MPHDTVEPFSLHAGRVWKPALGGFLLSLLLFAVVVFWFPRALGMPHETSFDSYMYAVEVVDGIEDTVTKQPFLAIYYSASSWMLPEFFAPLLHLVIILPALLVLSHCRHGLMILPAVTVALMFPEFVLFLSSVSKEGLAISAMVWAIAAIALFQSGSKIGAFLALTISTAVCELSRPYFSLVLWGALLIAWLLAGPIRLRIALAGATILSVALLHVVTPAISQAYESAADKVTAAIEFLNWFEEHLQSESAAKDFVRKALSLHILSIDSPWLLAVAAMFGLALKTAIYTFGIPLVGVPAFSWSTEFSWSIIWQFAASLTSLFLLHAGFVYLRNRTTALPPAERLAVAFAIVFATSIAASTLIFHVRYRAPAEFLLLVLALCISRPSARGVGILTLANAACISVGGLVALNHAL